MPTSRPFAYNSQENPPIAGAYQYGDFAIGYQTDQPYYGNYGGVKWFMGPDEDLGYVIAQVKPAGNVPTPDGLNDGTVTFWRSTAKDDSSFLSLANYIARRYASAGPFITPQDALNWLQANEFWTSWLPSYRYYRWLITETYSTPPNANSTQSAEFVFQFFGADQSMSGVTVTNPGGSNPEGEKPTELVDGNLRTKVLDLNFVSNGFTDLVFDFGQPRGFNGYRWATANDEQSRDPKSWTIQGGADGINWDVLQEVNNFDSTATREEWQTPETY
jgi:hypothetical protein